MGADWGWFYAGLLGAGRRSDPVDRLVRARTLIEERFADPLELDQLARAACYSRFHFLRLFEARYGETPGRFVQARRLQEARRLLVETDLAVSDVSLRVGFRSLGTFSRTFRERTGSSPVEYRRRWFPGFDRKTSPVPACFLAAFGGTAIPEKRADCSGR